MDQVAVGLVVGCHGLRGELKVRLLTDDPQRFDDLEELLVEGEGAPRTIESWRLHKGHILLLLAGVAGRDDAEALRGKSLTIPRELRRELPSDRFYHDDLVGLEARDTSGRIGVVRVFDEQSSASGLAKIRLDSGGWVEVPFAEVWIVKVDVTAGFLVLAPSWRQLIDPVSA